LQAGLRTFHEAFTQGDLGAFNLPQRRQEALRQRVMKLAGQPVAFGQYLLQTPPG